MTRAEQIRTLERLAAKLPAQFRALALVRGWDNLSFEEIREKLVMDEGALEDFDLAFTEAAEC
jgi:DNA-directed RNA polymerase specialized sigma24 family protein